MHAAPAAPSAPAIVAVISPVELNPDRLPCAESAPRQATNAAISRAGDLLFILKDDAELLIARSGAKGLETVKTYAVADSATWSAPAVSARRLFVIDIASLTLWTMD